METRSVRLRRAFGEATAYVLELADSVDDSGWGEPATDEWTVAELCVHTSRAASTITSYASEPAERELSSAAEYYVAVLADPAIHGPVAQRAKEQAAGVDEPVPVYLRRVFDEADRTLERTHSSAVLGTRGGGITLEDYLPTRITELVVHAIDLADALGVEPAVPETAMAVTLETLAEVSMHRPGTVTPAQVVRALTGRGTLAPDTNVLG